MKKLIFLAVFAFSSCSLYPALVTYNPQQQPNQEVAVQDEKRKVDVCRMPTVKMMIGSVSQGLADAHTVRWSALSRGYAGGVELNDSFSTLVDLIVHSGNQEAQLIGQNLDGLSLVLRENHGPIAGLPHYVGQFEGIRSQIQRMIKPKSGNSLSPAEIDSLQKDLDAANKAILRAGAIKALFLMGRLPNQQLLDEYLQSNHPVATPGSRVEEIE